MKENKLGLLFLAVLLVLMGLSVFLCEFADSVEEVASTKKYTGILIDMECSYRSTYNRSHIDFKLDNNAVLFFKVIGINCDQLYAMNLIGSSVVAYYTRGFAWQVDVNNQTLLPFATRKFDYNFMMLAMVNIPLFCLFLSCIGKIYRSRKNQSHSIDSR